MINVSNEFKQTMHTRTDFKEYAEITLVDGTVINLDETQFTVTNNSVTDGAALSSVPIGVAVQKIAQLEVLNDQEQWGNYDFFGAKIRLYMTFALSNSTEKVERGLYTVTTPETYGETVIITAYDDMYKADKNYSTTLSFPNTLKNMLIDICQTCSIPLLSTTFPHDDFTISTEPDGQYTYRQIISYIAMLAGGNARINNAGYLEIITFSGITSNAYYGNLDGIETGAPEHVLSEWQSLTMDKNDITVTGVAIKIDTQSGQEKRLTGNDGYVLTVSNPLINSEDETTLATAMHNVSEHLIGLKFRKFDGVSVSNPLIEFMDFVAVKDRRGRLYQSFVTDITFTFLGTSTIKNSAESAVRTETVYAGNVNTEIRMRKLVETEKSARELAVSNLSNALANSSGLYETAETQPDGSTIYYLHDKPTLSESKSVIKLTAEAIGLSTDGGKTYPYGFTITGEMVTRLLAVEGVNADWIKTGSLTVKDGSGSSIFSADMDSGTVTMSSALVSIDGKSFESKFAESKSYTDTQVAGATTTAATALDTANAANAAASNAQSTADGVKTDLATNYSTTTQMTSAIKQTADSITSMVSSVSTTATEALDKANSAASDAQAASSRIEQLKDSITLSVTDGTVGNTTKIKLGIDNETREASIDLTGAVSFSDLSAVGKTTINGANITTGTLSADRIDAAALFAKDITTTGNFQVNNSGHGIRLEDGAFKVGYGIWNSLAKWGYISFDGNAMNLNTIGPGGQINITSSTGVNITGTTLINGLQAANIPDTGNWTPVVEGASTYTLREGHYVKIGKSVALISFAIYGTFAGSTTSRIKITGCPIVSATGQDAGGGNLSGYYSASNVVFTGWNINKAGAIYAVGQQTGTTGATWGSTAIYQKASGDFSASGMIMVQTA